MIILYIFLICCSCLLFFYMPQMLCGMPWQTLLLLTNEEQSKELTEKLTEIAQQLGIQVGNLKDFAISNIIISIIFSIFVFVLVVCIINLLIDKQNRKLRELKHTQDNKNNADNTKLKNDNTIKIKGEEKWKQYLIF